MNGFIKQAEHQAKRPVTVERDVPDILVIEGVRYAGDLFRTFANPDDKMLYAMSQGEDGVVKIISVSNVEEARIFFEEVSG